MPESTSAGGGYSCQACGTTFETEGDLIQHGKDQHPDRPVTWGDPRDVANKERVTWEDVKGKEARGITKDIDLGEVQEVGKNYVETKKGTVSKDKFYIPKYLVDGYDGKTLWFKVAEGQQDTFKRDNPPTYEEYLVYKKGDTHPDTETYVYVIEEKRM